MMNVLSHCGLNWMQNYSLKYWIYWYLAKMSVLLHVFLENLKIWLVTWCHFLIVVLVARFLIIVLHLQHVYSLINLKRTYKWILKKLLLLYVTMASCRTALHHYVIYDLFIYFYYNKLHCVLLFTNDTFFSIYNK